MTQFIRFEEYESWVQHATRLVSVRLTVEQVALDGSVSRVPANLSGAGVTVEFRVSPLQDATIERFPLAPVTDGSDGEFEAEATLRIVGARQQAGIYVIDGNVADPNTPSLFQETIWEQQWELDVFEPMEVA